MESSCGFEKLNFVTCVCCTQARV